MKNQSGLWSRRGNVLIVDLGVGAPAEQGEFSDGDDLYPRVRRSNIDVNAQEALIRMLESGVPGDVDAAGTILDWVDQARIEGIYRPDQKVPAEAARSLGKGWWELLQGTKARMICRGPGSLPILIFKPDLDQGSLISIFRTLVRRNRISVDGTGRGCVDGQRVCSMPRCKSLFTVR